MRLTSLLAGISLCALTPAMALAQSGAPAAAGGGTPPGMTTLKPNPIQAPSSTMPAPPQAAKDQATPGGPAAAAGLDEIVVTAQRRSERLQDVPLTVTAVSGAQLDRAGITSITGLQNVVSGLTFSGAGTTEEPALRGVSSNISVAGAENPIALYVDGVYQLNQVLLLQDLPDASDIEVLKGPQGTLFGRNTTGGAILITTKSPSFTPTGNFTFEPGYYTGSGTSHGSLREDIKGFLSGPLVDGLLAGSLAVGYDNTDGYLTDDATHKATGRELHTNIRAKLLLTPAPSVKITLTGFYTHDNNEGVNGGTPYDNLAVTKYFPGSVVPTLPWHVANDPNTDTDYDREYGTNLKAQFDLSLGTLTSLTSYQNTYYHINQTVAESRGTPACVEAFQCIDYGFTPTDREFSQEVNFSSRQIGILRFTTGVFFFDARGGTVAKIDPTLFPGGMLVENFRFHTTSYAGYGEGTADVTSRLSLTAGLRYNYEPHRDTALPIPSEPDRVDIGKNFHSLTPRFSVQYKLSHDLNTYFTYSKGFRSGLTGVTNVSSIPQFAPVAPEELTSYEGGAKYSTRNLTFNGAFFYYDYKNKQESLFTGESEIVQNTGPVRIYGFDFDGAARLGDDLRFNANLTWIPVAKYLDFPDAAGQSTVYSPACGGYCTGYRDDDSTPSFDATGERLQKTPKVTANATLSYDHNFTIGEVDSSATVNYSSAYTNDITGEVRQSSYVFVNVQGGIRFRDSGVRVGIFCRNLTNKAYQAFAVTSSAGFNVGYSPPREVGVSLNYGF